MASHLSDKPSCSTATSPLSNEVWGLFGVSGLLEKNNCRTFIVEVNLLNCFAPLGRNLTPLPAAAANQSTSQLPLNSWAFFQAPVVFLRSLWVSPAPLQVHQTLLGLHKAWLHKPLRSEIKCYFCVALDFRVAAWCKVTQQRRQSWKL